MQRHLPIAAALSLAAAAAAQSYVNYESPIVSPVRISPDGLRLFAAHTADQRLCVYSLANPNQPTLVQEIVVGLEPVSVNPRTNDEVWVVNHMSDSVSVVSLSQGRVVATLQVADEPSDVVFAGGKAFVTAAASDRVAVFDATTRASLGSVDVFGKDPRNLAVNAAGTKVYAVVQRSGNGTTTVQDQAQTLPPGSTLPTPPRTSLIVRANDPAWAAQIPYTLPDNDVAEIDVATLVVSRNFRAVGTTNTGIAVHPTTGDLWVANTEARNLVRFEPVLKGHAIDNRITKITTGATPIVTPIDLNPGINYAQLPNNAALGTALSEPYGVAIDSASGRIYIAAQGTDRIGVLDGAGAVVARIEVGNTPGALVDTRNKRGPRGLALAQSTQRLYVANKLSSTISVIDTSSNALLNEVKLGSYDPTPTNIRDGRKFLYDAKLSGNGTMSCASCHTDGDIDGLSWDLGDPNGVMDPTPVNTGVFPFNALPLSPFHPMKGTMATQTFKGLQATAPFHWRGDRSNFQAFNGAFSSLMGGSLLSTADMNLYTQFATSIAFPPNPNQLKTRTLRTTPAGTSEQDGQTEFDATASNLGGLLPISCNSCHTHDIGNLTGTNRQIITNQILLEPQQMKVAQLRNMYRKVGLTRTAGQKKSGFGYTHDGSVGTLADFLALPVFNPWRQSRGANVMSKIVPFLMVLDTGTAPTVGMQITIDQANATNAAAIADLDLLIARAIAGDIDLVAHGSVSGAPAALLYSVAGSNFLGNATGFVARTKTQLLSLAQAGNAALTYMGVPPGAGQRIARDRDLDSLLDGDEASTNYGIATNGCPGTPRVRSNGEARLGSTTFALVGENAPASGFGYFVLGFDQTNVPIVGINLLVDLGNPSAWAEFIAADARGTHARSLPIPSLSIYDGLPIYTQYAWLDACQPQGLSASDGLRTALRANSLPRPPTGPLSSPPMPVPMIDLCRDKAQLAQIDAAVSAVVRSGQYILGPEVERLEAELSAYLGCKHTLTMSSGTDALLAPLMALGIGHGDEVLLPTYSFFATAGVVSRTGAKPVFLDVEDEFLCLDPQKLEDALKRSKNVKAVMAVHLFGAPFDVDAITSICRKAGVPLIEDAAQAIGTKYKGRMCGNDGLCAGWSTFPTKNLGGIGDGGFLTTNDTAFYDRCKLLRNHGQAELYKHTTVGGNFRMDAIQATALRVRLRDIEKITETRRENAERYRRLFAEAKLTDWLRLPTEVSDRHAYHQFVMRIDKQQRDPLLQHLRAQGIGSAVYYPIPFHLQPCFANLGGKAGDFPVAENAAATSLALPIFQGLTEAEQIDVVGAIAQFAHRR